MSKNKDITDFGIGFCFGTILMRSSQEGFYYKSINDILKKKRFYLVTVGDEEEEEPFFICGRELFTLYTVPQGFQVLNGSGLEQMIQEQMSEEDLASFHQLFGCSNFYSNHYRDLTTGVPYRYLNEIPRVYSSLQSCLDSIKPLGKEIRIYFINTLVNPYILEEILYYGNTTTSLHNRG
jgi:hypothetical protein